MVSFCEKKFQRFTGFIVIPLFEFGVIIFKSQRIIKKKSKLIMKLNSVRPAV